MICLQFYVWFVGVAFTVDGFLSESDLTHSNVQEQVWTWVNDGDEYFYDKNEWVRVRVEDEQWIDISPSLPSERGNGSTAERKSPYGITVSTPPLEERNELNRTGFDVAVWPWASRVVVGRWNLKFGDLTSRQDLISAVPCNNKAASVQTKHLHFRNFECTFQAYDVLFGNERRMSIVTPLLGLLSATHTRRS